MREAVEKTGANASVIFVPPPFAADAVMEAADAGLALVVCITEGIPTLDMMRAMTFLKARPRDAAGRPELPGRHLGRARRKAGIIPGHICKEGRIGIVSKSGTLTYEAIHQLTRLGMGQTTCIGIGGDPLIGTSHIDALKLFAADPDTDAVIMIGEIGGSAEEEAAAWIKAHFKKPVVGVHRRPDGAARAPHGPRRRDHRRRQGHRRREDGGAHRGGRQGREEPGRHGPRPSRSCSSALSVCRLAPTRQSRVDLRAATRDCREPAILRRIVSLGEGLPGTLYLHTL